MILGNNLIIDGMTDMPIEHFIQHSAHIIFPKISILVLMVDEAGKDLTRFPDQDAHKRCVS